MAQINGPAPEAATDWPWDAAPSELLAALTSSLSQQLADGPAYLLIDPLLGDVAPPIGARARHSVPGDALRLPAGQLPYLVELKSTQDPLLAQSIGWAVEEHLKACFNGSGAYRIGGWLQPHAPNGASALAHRLGALLVAHGEPQKGRYLRLADRRVLALLHQGASCAGAPAIGWARQLKGIANWVYLDANFALQTLQGEPGPPTNRPLHLDATHWHCLLDAEAINRSLTAWQSVRHPLPLDALTQVLATLARARRHGLHVPEDLAAYVAEALRFPSFEQYPDLPARIARGLQTQQPLAERLQALRDRWA